MSDDDLDRFNDSDSEPERTAAEPTASRKAKGAGSNANDSSPAAAHAGGGGKAAQRRAKKAAAKRARLQRRRQERERFPRDRNDGSGSGDDDDDGSDIDEGTAAAPAPKSSNAARVHHGVLNVEGVVVDGKLILLDRKSGAVYSATRRAPDGSHLRVGTWNPETRAVTRLTREEMEAQLNPPTPDGKRRKGRDGDGDGDGDGAGDESAPGDGAGDDESTPGDRDGGDGTSLSARMEKPPDEVRHAFDVDADDHCETSPEAHAHIVNFLNKTADALGKTPRDLVIYDPYYCAGGTKRSFAALGFPNVVNENKDFYAVCERGEVPAHDVLVTNPPYSADHVEKCITFAAKNLYEHGRPYFLLLPSYCVNKPYYTSALLTGGAEGKRARAAREEAEGGTKTKEEDGNASGDELRQEEEEETEEEEEEDGKGFKVHDGGKARSKKIATRDGGSRRQTLPFYVAPVKRYYYWTPKPLIAARKAQQGVDESGKTRRKKSHVGRLGERTSPFLSFWYCGMGDDLQPEALRWHRKLPRAAVGGYTVARNPNDLPMHVLDEWDPRRRAAVDRAKEAGDDGARPKRYAGFSGHNCGQNMDAKHKKKYKEFDNATGGKRDNWSGGKLGNGGMFKRPAKKRKY